MKRYKLTDARNARALIKKGLADAVGADEISVARWENGTQTPNDYHIGELCKFFGVKPADLNLDAEFNDKASTHSREDEIIAMLETFDRRKMLAFLSRLSFFAGVDLTALFSTTVVAPGKYLDVCEAVVEQCWNIIDQGGSAIATALLSQCVPELESLASHMSPYQHRAASLVLDVKIIQISIATHKMDYKRRVSLGSDAVLLAEMSGDGNLHALALGWHGDTYKNCYDQPETAINHLNGALKCDDISSLNKTDIYISLATAHALNKDEKMAREYIELAHMTMPENPEADPLYRMVDLGQSELYMREGKTYLILMGKFPEGGFADMACEAFKKSASKQAISKRSLGQALINQAAATRTTDNMHEYFKCLKKGVRIARQIGSKKQIARAVIVLQKTPMKWRNEQDYKDLCEILTPKPNIVTAQQ